MTVEQVEATMMNPQALKRAAELPRDLAVIQMENDSIMAMALAHPRNYAQVLSDLMAQVVAFPSFARSAMYSKPVGTDYDSKKMKFVRGLSIRAAEAIREAYGHVGISSAVVPISDTEARIEAQFTDYQRGSVWRSSTVVSKIYTDRYHKLQRHNDDRFNNVVCKAALSIAVREVILRCVPPGLKSELEECINRQVNSFLDDATVTKIVANFSEKLVSAEDLEKLLGKKRTDWTRDDRQRLVEVWTAIEDGETTVGELFASSAARSDKPTGTDKLAKAAEAAEAAEAAVPVADATHDADWIESGRDPVAAPIPSPAHTPLTPPNAKPPSKGPSRNAIVARIDATKRRVPVPTRNTIMGRYELTSFMGSDLKILDDETLVRLADELEGAIP